MQRARKEDAALRKSAGPDLHGSSKGDRSRVDWRTGRQEDVGRSGRATVDEDVTDDGIRIIDRKSQVEGRHESAAVPGEPDLGQNPRSSRRVGRPGSRV